MKKVDFLLKFQLKILNIKYIDNGNSIIINYYLRWRLTHVSDPYILC